MIGMAKIDLTPDLTSGKLRLNGYTTRGRKPVAGILNPVFARALVGSDPEGNLFGLVSADLCYIGSELRERVLQRVGALGLTGENLMLTATHTHSSYAGYDRTLIARRLFGPFDPQILEHTVSRIADALTRARESMRPALWEAASETIGGMNRSRLDPAFVFGGPDSNAQPVEPDRVKYPVDEQMTVFRFSEPGGGPIGALVHFAAHPTILSDLNYELSPDFPGELCDGVEQALGGGAVAMFLNGTHGDTAPLPDWTGDIAQEIDQMRQYGRALAGEALKILPKARPLSEKIAASKTATRRMSCVVLRPLGRLRLPAFISRRVFYLTPEVPFQALRLGEFALAGVPGEPTYLIGESIRELCPDGLCCLVVGSANGYIGYVVTPEQYDDGGYAADTCFFGPKVIDEVRAGAGEALSALG